MSSEYRRTLRHCRWCDAPLDAVPYLCWLFHRCQYCDREMARHHDAHHAPGVPPRL